jgi:hypothetical protein
VGVQGWIENAAWAFFQAKKNIYAKDGKTGDQIPKDEPLVGQQWHRFPSLCF